MNKADSYRQSSPTFLLSLRLPLPSRTHPPSLGCSLDLGSVLPMTRPHTYSGGWARLPWQLRPQPTRCLKENYLMYCTGNALWSFETIPHIMDLHICQLGKGGVQGVGVGIEHLNMDGSKILWWVPSCMTIAWILGLQLSWILCLGLVHTKLMRLGFWIFEKFHSRPELCTFEHG